MQIKRLRKALYKDYVLHYTYTSEYHYKASLCEGSGGFSFNFRLERLPEILHRDCFDTLFQPYWNRVSAFGVFEDDTDTGGKSEPIAVLELAREDWNNRLVITQLLVNEEYRGRGIGKMLIDKAKSIAVKEDFRLITLETQSCNIPAIDFYKKCGFAFAGTNLHFYSNDDISENEVMLEMVYLY